MARKFTSVLVTGASSGMGKDFALRLLKEGYTVFAAARSVDRMADLAEAGATVIGMDITRDADIIAAVETITEAGGIDVLINNAGFGQYGPVEDTPIDKARYQFEVNLFGLARLTQLLLPGMRAKGQGRVINISSMGGRMYTPLGAWYHATKHALEGWSDCLRLELKPHGIDVVVIEPGAILTGFGDAVVDQFAVADDSAYRGISEALKAATERTYARGDGSPVSVITDVVTGAIRADRPKTRYVAGKYARPLMAIRKYLGDRIFDRIIMSQVSG